MKCQQQKNTFVQKHRDTIYPFKLNLLYLREVFSRNHLTSPTEAFHFPSPANSADV